MKIVHVSAGYLGTGTSQKEELLAAAQLDAGHQVTVLASERPHASWSKLTSSGGQPRREPTIQRLPIRLSYGTLRWCSGVAEAVRSLEADVWHLHEPASGLPAQVIKYLGSGTPIVVDQHQYTVSFAPRWWVSTEYWLIRRHLVQQVYDRQPVIASPTVKAASFLSRHHSVDPKNVTVIALPADTSRFRHDPDQRQATRKALNVTEKEFLVATTGQLQSFKRHDLLLRGFAHAANQQPLLRLLIAASGDVHYERRLKKLSRSLGIIDRITWKPLVPETELGSIFNAADLAVWPLFPTVSISQALVSGCRVLLSDDPSQAQYRDLAGYYAAGQVDVLAKKILEVAKSSTSMAERRAQAERALLELSPTAVWRKYQTLYERARMKRQGA